VHTRTWQSSTCMLWGSSSLHSCPGLLPSCLDAVATVPLSLACPCLLLCAESRCEAAERQLQQAEGRAVRLEGEVKELKVCFLSSSSSFSSRGSLHACLLPYLSSGMARWACLCMGQPTVHACLPVLIDK
jgi:hypothetical protein